jgi:endonuclease YncB( thermonuclease family)
MTLLATLLRNIKKAQQFFVRFVGSWRGGLFVFLQIYFITSLALHAAPTRFLVKGVEDGDTIVLADGERVRYLGIDAPEVSRGDKPGEPYGYEASRFNRNLVLGRWVTLEFGEEKRDHYGRLLAFVFLEDSTFVNGELVRLGYAYLLRRQPGLPHWDKLLEHQGQALRARRGMWSIAPINSERYYLGNKRSWVFHRPNCPFGKKTAANNRIRFEDRFQALYKGLSPCKRCKP